MSKDLIKRQQQYLEVFDTGDYDKYLEKIPSKKLEKIKKSVAKLKTGVHAAAPLICLGP